jgi:hypothetical protein
MRRTFLRAAVLLSAAALFVHAAGQQADAQTGRLEFVAHVTPASGRTEPARGLTIFLLTKAFHDVESEAQKKTPPPDFEGFVEHTAFSKELKAWMKRERSVTISGPDFRKRVTEDDLIGVPEFFDAYVNGNLSGVNQGFPEPKYTNVDRDTDSKKYEKYHKEYEAQIRKYLALHPDSKDGMDTILEQRDPSPGWGLEVIRWRDQAHGLALQMAQTDYLAAKTETNLDGRGAFQASPGAYWLSTLDGEALAGEQRLRWDVAVEIRAGTVTRVELSNLNASKK